MVLVNVANERRHSDRLDDHSIEQPGKIREGPLERPPQKALVFRS